MGSDKKVEAGHIRYVLLKALGHAVLSHEVPIPMVTDALTAKTGRFIGAANLIPQ